MIDKKSFLILILIVFPFILKAMDKNDSIKSQLRKDTLPSFIGFSYVPALNWKILNINKDNGNLLYHFDQASLTSVEGNYNIRKIGLRMGLSANFDNKQIEKAYQYAGYLGIKNFWLRMQGSRISGDVEWTGSLPAMYVSSHNFNHRYLTVEILKTSNAYKHMSGGAEANKILGTFWGIGYSSFKIPIRMGTLILRNDAIANGIPGYDTLFSAKFFTAAFGFDILRQLCLTHGTVGAIPEKPAMKFGMYASTQDKIGFGSGKYSDFGISLVEKLNPGKKVISPEPFTTMVHYSLSVGFRYYITTKPLFMIFAAGYDLEGAGIIPFGKGSDNETDLSLESSFFFLNHGPSLKIYISFADRKKTK